jgi:voltage-gated potassium channel
MRKRTQIEIVISTIILIGIVGTISYHYMEGWSYVDSFYFTGITMMTIGYGDLHPTMDISKIFTVFFGFFGVGISLLALSLLASSYIESREQKIIGVALHRKVKKTIKTSETQRKRQKRYILIGSKM